MAPRVSRRWLVGSLAAAIPTMVGMACAPSVTPATGVANGTSNPPVSTQQPTAAQRHAALMSPSPSGPMARVGETVRVGVEEYVVTSVLRTKTLSSGNAKTLDAKVGEWVIINLSFRGLGPVYDHQFLLHGPEAPQPYSVS